MKTEKTVFKLKALFLAIVIILQGCASYQGSYTLQEALNAEGKVQITSIENEKFVYKTIDTLQGQWVGEKILKNNKTKLEVLKPETITKIEFERSAKAERAEGVTILTIIALPVLVIVGIAAAI